MHTNLIGLDSHVVQDNRVSLGSSNSYGTDKRIGRDSVGYERGVAVSDAGCSSVAGMTVHRVGTITHLARAPISLGMVAAMALWGRSIHRLGPQQTMIYIYLEPVSAVIIAAAMLGEVLHPIQAVGALLTFVGVGLASSH